MRSVYNAQFGRTIFTKATIRNSKDKADAFVFWGCMMIAVIAVCLPCGGQA